LEGIVVADLTQNVAGPFCTQTLGDMGAEVIKIERPGRGDDARAWAPPYWGEESATFISLNRNKKSLALDLKSPGGLEILHRLVGRADVFVRACGREPSTNSGSTSRAPAGSIRGSSIAPSPRTERAGRSALYLVTTR